MVMKAISTAAGALRVWPEPGAWTYEDYARLPDDGYRYEVIDGELYMSPAPSTLHQRILLQLVTQFHSFASRSGAGEVLMAPCDVLLAPGVVVQPDLLFIRADRRGIVEPNNVVGAPDLVVEILSPSDVEHDRERKHALYARHGVQEYWIVDPVGRTIEVYGLVGDGYGAPAAAGPGQRACSAVLAGFEVAVDEVLPAGG
jgi:Uma2 family endonuclease